MSMRDRITRAIVGTAAKPQFTPEAWTKELGERAAATADFNKMHDAYYTPGRAQSSLSEFAGPTRTVPIAPAPAPQFTPESYAKELADRAQATQDFNVMHEGYYGR